MIIDFNKQKNSLYLIFFYIIVIIFAVSNLYDYSVHIEEKFHRLNGLFWLNYIADVLNLSKLQEITKIKIDKIYDYTLSPVTIYNKYGIILDLPAAIIEILFKIEDVKNIYYLKHFLSFFIFLISSVFFFKILNKRYQNFHLSFIGVVLYVTTPRIFGDSFLYKDVLFLSLFMITLYYFLKSIEKINYKNLFYFSLFSALSINLRIFAIIIPFLFLFVLCLRNFHKSCIKNNLKKISYYFFLLIFFTYALWPYLWESPFSNFLDLFKSLKKDLIQVKVFYNNSYISNKFLPDTYIFNWVFITSPLLYSILFSLGYFFCFKRMIKRYFSIKEKSIYYDLWRGKKEEIDFIFLFILTFFILFFLMLNAPFYNGWRLIYFLNIFIIYFIINFLYKAKTFYFRSQQNKIVLTLTFFLVFYNIFALIKLHPFQSIYFNSFVSEKIKNSFEGDYYGLGTKHFFNKILEIEKSKINIAVASHTPIQRGLESLSSDQRTKINIVGQEYNQADYIFKNNISEVNPKFIKKYQIPENFSKIYELKIDKIIIYEIFKRIE